MKYKLTENKKVSCGIALYQIEALKDFRDIEKGDKGGYVEKENNLSQDGNAWVFGDARVSGNAWVFGDARVSGDAEVSGNAEVFGDAWVSGNARVFGNAEVFGNARVSGNARVFGNAEVSGNAWVSGNARVSGDAEVSGNARVSGNAEVSGRLKLLAGYFFGIRYQKEEIKYKEINEKSELIYKGEAKFGEEEDKPKNEIIIDGIKYRKIN